MKKLTRMKLINWHRFENCTIDFDGSTLISGENGAGKSTLLDAIQYVITCSANSFNKAAHENGKRKLTGYIRCKSGRETRPYERTGEICAHVALEFYEESRDAFFVIGVVIDSASEGQETSAWYLMDHARISDDLFFLGKCPRSISQFRAANATKQWCKTRAEARKMIKSRLGRLDDKFFRLIPKALAFKPIDDIKDFVYSYVLDEKQVNIVSLQENVRAYQDLERTLESVKIRIEKLGQIEKYHTLVEDCVRRDRMYEYFLARADAALSHEEALSLESQIRAEEYQLEIRGKEHAKSVAERDQVQEMETSLRVELSQDQDFLALEAQKKQLASLRADEEAYLKQLEELKGFVRQAMAQAGTFLSSPLLRGSEKLPPEAGGEWAGETEHTKDLPDPSRAGMAGQAEEVLKKYRSLFSQPEKIRDIAEAKALLDQVTACKRALYETMQREMAQLRIRLRQKQEQEQELKQRIADLGRKKLSYPPSVERLIAAIREEFARLDRKTQPHILCELLEISDESWRNAVEGYLNTQRFYVLVEPESFDIALSIYDRLRRQGKAYGAGLINTEKMKEYDTAPEDSLAAVVVSRNRHARRYINMVLGKVHCCERFEDLKKYPTSITRECMRYQNRVASAIKPEIFQVPFIGKQAFKVQLAQASQQEAQLKDEIDAVSHTLGQYEKLVGALDTNADMNVQFRLDVLINLRTVGTQIRQTEENIKTLQKNATLFQKRMQLETLEKMRKDLEQQIEEENIKIGGLRNAVETGKEHLADLQEEICEKRAAADQLGASAEDRLETWEREYAKQTSDKSVAQFKANFERTRKANETSRQNAYNQMTGCMNRYCSEHDFGAPATMEGFAEFASVYDRLRTSELLEYEEKVQTAKSAAEEEFREQFLAKLQENMKQAQGEFRDLNRALKDITFSSEKYEFLFMPSRKHRSYYEMIMDDFNAVQGKSLFSGVFHEAHKEVIEELFDTLAVSSENHEKALETYTDYRTYMDYDIKIIHSDGSYSYYSKVCEEKSGGETQTPFYVTVAASFVQLYSRSIGGEAAGLILFDEAFNNMDDERIGGVLEFMNRLPLQMIISAPPEKIQYIAPAISETLLIMTDEKVSYVEEYHNRA